MAQILVVDDSSNVRDEISNYLIEQGIDVVTAVDGEDGLAKVQQHTELKLVLSDVNMPNMDGLTMVKKIREFGSQVQIIMLTTEDSAALKQQGKILGVKGWIVKPFNGSSIIGAIKRMIE